MYKMYEMLSGLADIYWLMRMSSVRSWSSLGGGDGGSRESTRILPADVVKTGYLKKLKVEIDIWIWVWVNAYFCCVKYHLKGIVFKQYKCKSYLWNKFHFMQIAMS